MRKILALLAMLRSALSRPKARIAQRRGDELSWG